MGQIAGVTLTFDALPSRSSRPLLDHEPLRHCAGLLQLSPTQAREREREDGSLVDPAVGTAALLILIDRDYNRNRSIARILEFAGDRRRDTLARACVFDPELHLSRAFDPVRSDSVLALSATGERSRGIRTGPIPMVVHRDLMLSRWEVDGPVCDAEVGDKNIHCANARHEKSLTAEPVALRVLAGQHDRVRSQGLIVPVPTACRSADRGGTARQNQHPREK